MKKLFSVFITIVSLPLSVALAQPAPGTSTNTNTPAPAAQPATNSPAAQATATPLTPRPNSAIIPNLNRGFIRAHTNFVEIAKKGDIDVLFMGDSITDWWRSAGRGARTNGTDIVIPTGGKAVFEKYFGSWKVANFGIAGDTTQGVLYRLQNGEGEGFKPKAIMLMIGTNNTGRNSPPEIAMGVADIVFELRKDFPDAKILLLAIFPRSIGGPTAQKQIDLINPIISALHDNQHVFFMDIGPKFLSEDGTISRDIMADGLHPTNKGYEIWAEAVHDTLAGWLQ